MRFRILMVLFFIFLGSQVEAVELKVTYNDTYQLKPGDRVLLDEITIGKIKEISVMDDGLFLFKLTIKRKFFKKLTEFSQFYPIYDPDVKDKMAIEVVEEKADGAKLSKKTTVQGATGTKALSKRMKSRLKHTLDQFGDMKNKFSDSIKNFSKSDDIQNLKGQLQRMGNHIQRMGKSTKQKFSEEVLPQLESEMTQLKEKLKKLGKHQEAEELDKEFQKIKDESTTDI